MTAKKRDRKIRFKCPTLKETAMYHYLKLEIFIPKTHIVRLASALREADAGHIGNYDSCLSVSPVESSWRPLEGTKPYRGTQGKVCTAPEIKAEVTIRSSQLDEVLDVIRSVHPYEEPVVNVLPLFGTMQESEKVLVLCGDRWHPAEVVEKGLASFPEQGYEFEIVKDAKDILTPDMLSRYRNIMICKSNEIDSGNAKPWFEEGVTEVTPAHFVKFAEEGGNLTVIHSGAAFFKNAVAPDPRFTAPNEAYMKMTGCEFLSHPLRCSVTYKVTDRKHPLTQGVEDFTERDEHYQVDFFAEDARILMKSYSADGKIMPAVWERKVGTGHLVVILPGHTLRVWQNVNFQRLVCNALNYK